MNIAQIGIIPNENPHTPLKAETEDHNVITCPHCGAKLVINLSVSDKKHD